MGDCRPGGVSLWLRLPIESHQCSELRVPRLLHYRFRDQVPSMHLPLASRAHQHSMRDSHAVLMWMICQGKMYLLDFLAKLYDAPRERYTRVALETSDVTSEKPLVTALSPVQHTGAACRLNVKAGVRLCRHDLQKTHSKTPVNAPTVLIAIRRTRILTETMGPFLVQEGRPNDESIKKIGWR